MSVADKIAKQLATALNSEQIKEICDIILDDALCGGDNLQLFEPLLFPLALQARGRPIVKLVESVYVRIVTTRQQMQEFIAVGTALQCLLSVYLEDSSIFHCSCSIELPVLDGLPKFTLPITSRDELFTLSSFWLNTTISFARLGSFSESNRSDVSDIIAVMAYSSGKLQSPTSFMKVLASSVSMLLQRKTTLAFNATVGEGLLSWLIIGFNKLGGKSEAAVLIEKETAAFMVDTAQLVADAVGLIIKASESSLVNSFNSFIFLFIEDNLSPFTIAAQSNSPESIISVEVSKHYGYLLLQLYLETVQQSTSELFDCKSLFGVLINCCSNLDSYSLVARILIAGLNRDRKFVMAVKSVLLSAAVESNHPRKKQKVEENFKRDHRPFNKEFTTLLFGREQPKQINETVQDNVSHFCKQMIAYEIALHVTKREGLSVEVLDGIANHLVLTSVAVSCSKNIKGPERSRAQSVWVFFSLFSRNNFTEELRISNGVESFSEQLRHVFQMLKSTENIFWGVSLPILGDENSKKKIWVIVMGIFYTDLLNIGGYQAITGEIEALIVRSNLKVELLSTILQIGSSKFTYQAKGINSTSSFFSKVIDLTKNLILGTCDLSNYGCVNYLQAFSVYVVTFLYVLFPMNSREVKLLIQKNASQKLLSEKIINGEDNYLRITQAIASDPSSLPLSASLLTALQRWKLDKFEAHESSDTIETDDIVMISKILAEVLNILNPLLRPQLQRVVDISQGAVGAVDGSESCELFDDATATSTLHNTLQQKEGFISVIRLCVMVHIMAMTMFILYDEILPTAVVDDLKAINGALSDSFVSLMTCNQVFKKDRDVISQWISAQLVYAAHRHKSNLADFSGNKIVISILAVFSTEILQESSIKGVYTFCSTMHILAPQHVVRLIADVVRLWTEVQPVERILHNLLEGLFNSFGEIGLMQRVFTSSPDHFIKWIIAPLCSLRDSDDGLASYILGRIIDSVEMDVRDNRIMKLFQYKMVGTIFYCLYPDIDMFGKALRYLQITVNRGSLAEGAPRAIASTIMHLLINKFKIHCIKAHLSQLAIALNCNLDSTTGSFLSNGALHQILLPIIWELGGNQRHAAFQAFGIICMAFLQSRWDILFPNDEKDRDQYYREAISEVLPTSFLFFMTNALQNMWHFMSPSKIIQSLKSLKVLITLLPKHHLSNYLPKIMIMLSDALSYRHLQVQISSAQITEFLCDNLPPDTLNSYLPSLLIELYRFIEESNSDSGTEDEQSFCSCYQLDVNGLYEIDCHFALDDDPFHDEFVKFAQYNFRSIISVKLNKQAKALAISIIKKAFSNITDIRCGLLSVPYLPDVRELSNCRQAHNDLIATLSFDEAIKSLCTLLSHESKALRLAALHVLKEKCNIMMATIYETPSESVSTVIADNTVSETMEALLELVARETDPQLMGACADCLGEIGAIDPARFRQRLSLVADRSLASLAKAPPPWDLTEVDYALEILQKHLVPSLKSAGPSQDRSGYAIQKILKRLSILLDATQAAERHQQMPESLCDVLLSRNIYDLVLPFWSTNYNIKDVTTHSTPLFTSTMPYGRWIGLWVRYLNSQVSGKFQSIFEACRGVVRTRSELAQYLLPYLVADVLTYSADRKAAAEDLKNEICLVLSSNEDQTRQGDGDILDDINNTEISSGVSSRSHNTGSESAIQVVFMLLDTLKSWQTTGLMILHSFKAGKKTSTAKRNEKIINLENFLSGMNDLINIIPTTLLVQAAIRVKAFTRAVREIEIHSREFHRKKRLNNSSIAVEMSYKDHANGVLPVLAIEDIETLLDIHAKLDDTDQMQGLLMLSQIFGYPTKISNRILFMEHTHDWVGALVEYGVITASTSYQQVLTSMSHRTKGTSVQNVNQPELRDNQEETLTAETVHQLEKGKLKCWIEMGQLSAAIEQVKGITSCAPELEASLLPLGVEASWKLARWNDLEEFLGKVDYDVEPERTTTRETSSHLAKFRFYSDYEQFQIGLGKIMLTAVKKDENSEQSFHNAVQKVKIETVHLLSAAAMESYSRAYPLLFRLHLLSDISHHKMIEMEVNEPGRVSVLDRWNYRAVATAPSISERSTLSGAHRTILSLYGKNERIAANWLSFSKFMRSLGKFDMAKLALRNAESVGLDADVGLMEEAYILKASGEIQKALNLIEPTEIDPIMILRSLRPETLSSYLDTEEKRHRLAAKIQFATELMILSRQKHGRSILDRYKCITALNRHWEKAYYDFGRYYETLYTEMKNNEDAVSDTNRVFSGTSRSGRSQSVAEERVNVSYEYLKKAVERYGLCLKIGSKMTTQALTRMLTLWLTFCSLEEGIDSSQLSSSRATESALSIAQKDCNVILGHSSGQVSSSVWFKCTTQLVSRVGHRNKNTLAIIVNILTKVIANYPAQGIWQIAGLLGSFNKDRRGIGFKILMDAHGAMQKEKPREAKMLEESNELFKNLVDLAKFDAKDKKMKWRTPADLTLSSFLVPTQRALTNCDKLEGLKDEDRMRYVGAERMFIGRFDQIVDVASSKAKPKTLAIHTMCGKKVKFLCKQEKDGDLRKDARMMEFNSVVNGLLAEDQEGRKRNLRLRTYSVLCLNEECGILEWVNNTECLRALIGKAHSYWPELYPPTNYKALYDNFLNAQKINDTNLNGTVENYIHNVLPHCHPCFHKWFIEKFVDPTEWYEARNTFTRSAAVWSAVGHVIGLGDRHTENILIDVTIGECVHVDFDCLFDKGLSLNRPEIVPFRLTPSMVDGMGPMGVEGSYRRAMEVTMTVLRSNSDNLLAVLEPFLRDPTVSWQRNGRTQQRNEARSGKSTTSGFVDYENKEAAEMLKKISQRLEGVYNLVHPHRIGYLRGCESRGEAKPVRGLGASKEDSLPLSVPGQVQRLIEEATAIENLCQMFVGKWLVTLLCLLVKAYEGRELFRVAAMDVVGEHLTSYEQ